MKDYYEILEVNRLASSEVIEKAYKVLVQKYHPDKQQGIAKTYCENKMQEINEAYEVLSNPFLKEQYDAEIQREELEKQRIYEEQQNFYHEQQRIYHEQQEQQIRQDESTMKNKKRRKKLDNAEGVYQVGTFSAILALTKKLFKDRKFSMDNFEAPSKKGVFAIMLTIIIVIIIGVILWFIPFTNGWMRELLFENPLFNWIGGLFS